MRDVPIEDRDESEESRSAKLVAPRCARNWGSPDHRSVLQEETMTERHVAPRCARTHLMIGKPKRLDHLFGAYSAPIYFITAVTARRARVLATEPVHAALRAYALDNLQEGRAMGRYVIMPDHLHFFVRLKPEARVSDYVRWLKSALTRIIKIGGVNGFVWQPGFFDHVMRGQESYTRKWDYVRLNPVRAGLVGRAEEWPFQGEVERIAI